MQIYFSKTLNFVSLSFFLKSMHRPSIIHDKIFLLWYLCFWCLKIPYNLISRFGDKFVFFELSTRRPPSTSYEFSNAIFVFLASGNSLISNFKVKGQIWKFRQNRRVDPQTPVLSIFFDARFVLYIYSDYLMPAFSYFQLF